MSQAAFLLICLAWGASFILMERATASWGRRMSALGDYWAGLPCWLAYGCACREAHRISCGDLVRIAGLPLVSTSLPFVVQPYCSSRGFGTATSA
ncbi:MAG: hypothetical protein U0805_13590 [Pirellulales bacterium]